MRSEWCLVSLPAELEGALVALSFWSGLRAPTLATRGAAHADLVHVTRLGEGSMRGLAVLSS